MNIEHRPWPKTARLNREVIITEKIDGTNAAVGIVKLGGEVSAVDAERLTAIVVTPDGEEYGVYAQSRTRIITPGKGTDNFGFAGWVQENALDLVLVLGEGLHFGEWFGKGIQRGYDMDIRAFALFDVTKRQAIDEALLSGVMVPGLRVVPTLYRGVWSQRALDDALEELRDRGSFAAPRGHFPAEGVIVYHTAARVGFKVLLEGDDVPKSVATEHEFLGYTAATA